MNPFPTGAERRAGAFFNTPAQRVALARERFFEQGERPTGLVAEAVIQSWGRCAASRREPGRAIAFEPVTRARLRATLERNQRLVNAAADDLRQLEAALAGTGCRVLLTDARSVVVHATPAGAAAEEPVLRHAARIGVDLSEGVVGTNAPALVAHGGEAVTVLGAEHYFHSVHPLQCAAAPIRDGRGALAGVLDLTVEARPFGFDAAALVGVYATLIENRLLQAAAGPALVLRFQVCPSLLDSPLQALAGVDAQGRLAWLNGTATRLLGGTTAGTDAQALFGLALPGLLAWADGGAARPLALPNGLTVWLHASGPPRRAAPPLPAPDDPTPADAPAAGATDPDTATTATPTLDAAARGLIERTLAECGGNVSHAARRLGVSRGLLYRRLRGAASTPRFP